jgi:hypothetical protein
MGDPVHVVRQAYEAFSCGDWQTARSLVHPRVAWSLHHSRPGIDPYAERVGPTGLMSFWASVFRQYRVRPERFIARGNRVVVPVDLHGRGGRGTDHLREFWSVQVTEGRVTSVDEYGSLDDALEAADSPVDRRHLP